MKRVFYGREYELEEGVDWCSGCAFDKGRRKCWEGGNPPPVKYCRPDHHYGAVLIWKEAGAKAEPRQCMDL